MPQTTRFWVDPDVDPHVARQRWELRRARWAVLAAISADGAGGALARYGLATLWPYGPRQFPWATFVTNITGCLLIGVLMVLITEVWSAHRLLRPFLGGRVACTGPFGSPGSLRGARRVLRHRRGYFP